MLVYSFIHSFSTYWVPTMYLSAYYVPTCESPSWVRKGLYSRARRPLKLSLESPSHLIITPGICFAVSEGYQRISKSANPADDFVLCGKITPLSSGSTCLCSWKGCWHNLTPGTMRQQEQRRSRELWGLNKAQLRLPYSSQMEKAHGWDQKSSGKEWGSYLVKATVFWC